MKSPHPNRREFLGALALSGFVGSRAFSSESVALGDFEERVQGLLVGSFIGDALGGPVEFQDAEAVQRLTIPPHVWQPDEVLDDDAIAAARSRFRLQGYGELRPDPEPYGQWVKNAPPGTVTDDSRHKLILLEALREARRANRWPLDRELFAETLLAWPQSSFIQSDEKTQLLCSAWLAEWESGARWVLGDREATRARPPERMWGGLPTCCGQMSLLPLAALYPGDPNAAYRHAYELGFFDNGFAKDLNPALVAGLSSALVRPPEEVASGVAWDRVQEEMRATDPYAYGEVPWVTRPVDRWLDFARDAVVEADGRPARVFAAFEYAFRETIKWEAQVPFAVAAASLNMSPTDPLAAMQLSIEWGHDTDSYAQIVGAFAGALFGVEVFPEEARAAVLSTVRDEYGVDLMAEAKTLATLQVGGL